eukprot:COSAG03_NODE_3515_length_1972_cov_255.497064_2_plen_152_part_00
MSTKTARQLSSFPNFKNASSSSKRPGACAGSCDTTVSACGCAARAVKRRYRNRTAAQQPCGNLRQQRLAASRQRWHQPIDKRMARRKVAGAFQRPAFSRPETQSSERESSERERERETERVLRERERERERERQRQRETETERETCRSASP